MGKCYQCRFLQRHKQPDSIGICELHWVTVIDSLCGCNQGKDGKYTLRNFRIGNPALGSYKGRKENDMKEQLLTLINRHNAVVTALEDCQLPVPEGKLFMVMTIWHKLACEGADITHLARENGIDAKCDMQAGRIPVYGDLI